MRWRRGEADIEAMLRSGELQQVTGAAADGTAWLTDARTTLASARLLAARDPRSASTLGYDAARHACAGLLAQQGLRATQAGGHVAVERAVVAQFGDAFRGYGSLRRLRNELEYPNHPGEPVGDEDAADVVANAERILDAVERLLPEVGLF